MMMWYGGNGWGWGGWILMTVLMVVFWALVITAVVLAIRYLTSPRGTGATRAARPGSAEDLLAERYARGEITDDEYQQRLTVLRQHR